MKDETLRVVFVEPGKPAQIKIIPNTLEAMQRAVGGYIEATYPFSEEVCLVSNEEGKICHLPYNRALRDTNGSILDVIAGSFFLCGCGEEDFVGLTDRQVDRYLAKFAQPESFKVINGKLIIIEESKSAALQCCEEIDDGIELF